jgi:hypothetical protein
MQINLRAIVQSEYGAPEKVLQIANRRLDSEQLGTDDVVVKGSVRPVHPGDIQILSAPSARWPRKDRNCITNKPSLGRTAYGNRT